MTAPRVATVTRVSGTGPGEVPGWVERWGAIVLVVGLSLYLITTAIWLLAYAHQVDMSIYRFGGESLIHRRPLYDVGLSGRPDELLFNYPPFAAVVFAPLALVPLPVLRLIVPISNLLILAMVIRRCWRAMGIRESREVRSLTMMGVGALICLEPVHTTIALGQIGLVLLAVLLLDLLPLAGERRWSGVGVGLAAGVKLTPLFFIPYLLLTGRVRAAVVASATFAATIGVGFLVDPSQGAAYWFGGTFHDLSRILATGTSGNASIYGLLSRTSLTGGTLTATWLAAATLTGAACLVVAARAHVRGEVLLGVALCGLGSAAASPFSWATNGCGSCRSRCSSRTKPSCCGTGSRRCCSASYGSRPPLGSPSGAVRSRARRPPTDSSASIPAAGWSR